MKNTRTAAALLILTLVISWILLACHEGEFFPFSIYPMFSGAGRPWSRALVRDVTHVEASAQWKTCDLRDLPGEAVALDPTGVETIDLADYINKTTIWTPQRLSGLRALFGAYPGSGRVWIIYRVTGHLIESGIMLHSVPHIRLAGDSITHHPTLPH